MLAFWVGGGEGWEKDSSCVVHTYPRVSLQEMPSAAPAPLHSGAPEEIRGGSTEWGLTSYLISLSPKLVS